MSRKPIVVGNWKMNNDLTQTQALLRDIYRRLSTLDHEVDVGVAPPFLFLAHAGEILADDRILLAAQNSHHADSGAYTGEVSPRMLKSVGVDLVIVGHSERRQLFGETDEIVNLKAKAVVGAGLEVIVCVGETLAEREGGRTLQKVGFQVKAALEGLTGEEMSRVVVAYEPVWAIGTGKTATPAQAQSVHASIREILDRLYGGGVAERTRIEYGGSVNADNAAQLMCEPDIDGALVGGASLRGETFETIVRATLKRS